MFASKNSFFSFSSFRGIVATGGTITNIIVGSETFRVHSFTSVGTSSFVVSEVGEVGEVEYLVVAGGGSGGKTSNRGAGGGGAGGYRSSVAGEASGGGAAAESPLAVTVGTYDITVGNGGAGVGGSSTYGVQGGNSSIIRTSPSVNIVSTGGGAGGRSD
jgi:hypothetical protein